MTWLFLTTLVGDRQIDSNAMTMTAMISTTLYSLENIIKTFSQTAVTYERFIPGSLVNRYER